DLLLATAPVAVLSTQEKSFHTPQVQTSISHLGKGAHYLNLSFIPDSGIPNALVLFSPGLQRQDSGHWWSSFFFANKQNQPGSAVGSDQKSGTYTVTNGQVTCAAIEMVLNSTLNRQLSESSDSGKDSGSHPPY
uniref:Uncharacterized protein n=1 Tax=Esox lucius TaxID=8010 RepID=A0AAY5KLK9_ESOLU